MIFWGGYMKGNDILVFHNDYQNKPNDPHFNIVGDVHGGIYDMGTHWSGYIVSGGKKHYFKIIDNLWKHKNSPKGIPDKLILDLINRNGKHFPEQIGVLWQREKDKTVRNEKNSFNPV